MGIRCADHVTSLYPQKLALTSPTGGGRSVGIVRSRNKATELVLVYIRARTYFWYLTVHLQKSESFKLFWVQEKALNGRPLLCQGLEEHVPKPSWFSYFLGGDVGFVSQTRKPDVPKNIFLDFSQLIRCNTFMLPEINPRPLPQPVTQYPLTALAFNAVFSKSNKP